MNFVVVGRRNCPYCDKAKELIRNSGNTASYYSIEESGWLLDLFKKAAIKTVPQIWTIKGEYIGGYTQLETYMKGETYV